MKNLPALVLLFIGPFLLDLMMNRDTGIYIDEYYKQSNAWPEDPYSLCPIIKRFWELPEFNPDNPNRRRVPDQIDEIEDILISSGYITGLCKSGTFVVDRVSHDQHFFADIQERDLALKTRFSTDIADFQPPPDYGFIRANVFFPYNLIYYGVVILTIFALLAFRVFRSNRAQSES